jgi:hypothetical protein
MNQATDGEVLERELAVSPEEVGALAMLNQSEISTQIATAKRYPRSVTKFIAEATSLVALNDVVADECIYSLPRDGKTIEGPSARFAEICAYSWGNCRSAARVVDESAEFVTAQGVHWDLEKNTAIGYEVKRRITDKHGRRYKPDMIGVTANAACSIALRNAILKGIPKALWSSVYDTARKTIMGDFQTLANRRAVILQNYQKFGVSPERVFEKLQLRGEEDITLEHILILKGMLNALKEGDTTPEDLFPAAQTAPASKSASENLKNAVTGSAKSGTAEKKADPKSGSTGKIAGTLEQRGAFVAKFGQCQDAEILSLVMDETRELTWSDADQAVLTEAYNKRLHDLS